MTVSRCRHVSLTFSPHAIVRWVLIWGLALCSLSSYAAPLTLNGLSKYSELRRDFYIGALYLETATDSEQQIFNNKQAMRMVIRVSNKRWSPRSFEQHWTQSILINNEEETLSVYADSILAFTALTKEPLTTGDEIIIDRAKNSPTTVSINSVELLSVADSAGEFFKLLLNAWLGPRPPSSDFKRHILGQTDSEQSSEASEQVPLYKAQFDRLLPAPGREAVINQWLSSEPVTTATIADSKKEESGRKNTAIATTKIAIAKPTANPPPNAKKAAPENILTANKPAIKINASAEPTIEKTTTPNETQKQNTNNRLVQGNAPERQVVTSTSTSLSSQETISIYQPTYQPTPPTETQPEPKQDRDVEQKLSNGLRLLYRSNVLKRVYAKVVYPSRAASRRQEGKANMVLHLSQEGKLLDLSLKESSGFAMLDRAAMKAVRNAEPFPTVPKKILSQTIKIDIPIRFRLSD